MAFACLLAAALGLLAVSGAPTTTQEWQDDAEGACSVTGDEGADECSTLQARKALKGSAAVAAKGRAAKKPKPEVSFTFTGFESGFNTDEHKIAGDAVKLSNGYDMSSKKFTTSGGYNLTYGDFLSLCGDWYGKDPISDVQELKEQQMRFTSGPWHCIDTDPDDPKRVYKIMDEANGDCGACLDYSEPEGCASYLGLARENWDHFAMYQKYSFEDQGGAGAWEVYHAGHTAACEAAAASSETSALDTALMMNACASHYLSDLFSAGHLRQPRRILGTCFNSMSANCFMSKQMHDEDCLYGLNVTNARGDSWRSYGDSCQEDPANQRNWGIHVETLTASAEAVLQAWKSSSSTECSKDTGPAELIPNLAEVQDLSAAKARGNSAPLVIPTTGDGCGRVLGECTGLGEGKITGAYDRGDACNMQDYELANYGYYMSDITVPKLMILCPLETRSDGVWPPCQKHYTPVSGD